MSPANRPFETLRVGHATRSKVAVAAAAFFGWLLTYSTLTLNVSPLFALIPGALGFISSILLYSTLRSGYSMHRTALHHTIWSGRRTYSRSAFLGAEVLEDGRGESSLLLRFRNGVLMLSAARDCSDPQAVRAFLEQYWQIHPEAPRQDTVGPVVENIVMQYEGLHLVCLAVATLALAGLSALGPMFWVSAVLAFFTGRTFHRLYSCQRITTSFEGLTISRPLQPDLKMRWDKITSVRYWYSLAHGGMLLSDGTNTIRVYRWIENYPRFNRQAQDSIAPASFAPTPELPWTISLNRRRQSNWIVLLLTAGVAAWLVAQGAWPAALILMGIPSITFALTVVASGRRIVIDKEKLRLIEKKIFVETTRDYRRADLQDMRLGRQLSVGGLWLKFGAERLEIGNLDSARPPEKILATLRHCWKAEVTTQPSEFRAA